MFHFSPFHFNASSLSITLPYLCLLHAYVHSRISLLLCASLWQSRHSVIRFSIACIRFLPIPAGTIWCMFTPCLPQYWQMLPSRSSTALISFFDIGLAMFVPFPGRKHLPYAVVFFFFNIDIACSYISFVICSGLSTL